jgi:hypothetical protein
MSSTSCLSAMNRSTFPLAPDAGQNRPVAAMAERRGNGTPASCNATATRAIG